MILRASVLLVVLLSGCAAKPALYSWGNYEGLVYSSYSEPGKLSPEDQILKMEEDYQKARAATVRNTASTTQSNQSVRNSSSTYTSPRKPRERIAR